MNLKERIENSFATYAAMTIQHRAIVDARDCLKPAARMAFYAQYLDKIVYPKPHKKTHKSVTSAMDHFYVHGDASMAQLLARLARKGITMRYPLEDAIGNMGTFTLLDNAAAPRYTEMRLGALGVSMLDGIKKNTIDTWFDNFDNTEKFPSVLPSLGFYNIVNGTTGIATALASSIPQFNLREVNEAMIKLLWDPDIDFDEIYCAPDFITGATLLNATEVKESLRVGQGKSAILRGTIEYNPKDNSLHISEIPYNVATSNIKDQINALFDEDSPAQMSKYIERFTDSSEEQVDITIWLTKAANPRKIIKDLYKHTMLQYHFPINVVMLDKGTTPKVYGWKDALNAHLDHEKEVRLRIHKFEIEQINKRIFIIDGIIVAIENIDDVVALIRKSQTKNAAKEALMNRYNLAAEQADAILKITLSKLANLEVQGFYTEKENLLKEREAHELALNDQEVLFKEIEKDLRAIANQFGDERKTRLQSIDYKKESENAIEEIPSEDVVVIVSRSGMIKRVPKSAFKVSHRNTKGVKTIDDAILTSFSTNTTDTLMVFTSSGKLYRALVDTIPTGDMKSAGTHLSSLISIDNNETVIAATALGRQHKARYVCFITKQGLIKKTPLEEYFSGRKKTGISAIKLKENDTITAACFIDNEEIIITTHNGMLIRIESEKVTPMGRVAMGVKAITLMPDDYTINGFAINGSDDTLGIFTEEGKGKRVKLNEFIKQQRGGKGILISKQPLASTTLLNDNDTVFIQGRPNSICINAKEIPVLGRIGIGNIIIKQSKIVNVIKL